MIPSMNAVLIPAPEPINIY